MFGHDSEKPENIIFGDEGIVPRLLGGIEGAVVLVPVSPLAGNESIKPLLLLLLLALTMAKLKSFLPFSYCPRSCFRTSVFLASVRRRTWLDGSMLATLRKVFAASAPTAKVIRVLPGWVIPPEL